MIFLVRPGGGGGGLIPEREPVVDNLENTESKPDPNPPPSTGPCHNAICGWALFVFAQSLNGASCPEAAPEDDPGIKDPDVGGEKVLVTGGKA